MPDKPVKYSKDNKFYLDLAEKGQNGSIDKKLCMMAAINRIIGE